jgi:hypothetical protein
MVKICLRIILSVCFLLLIGCALKPTIHPDYNNLRPNYVLVLPPENTTSGTEIEETVYPILYEKFSRRGYYCLSPELARGVFNANKLEDAGRINSLPPQKFKEIFGVDAILKVRVTDWSSKYAVITSTVNVEFEMELIHAETGAQLWYLKNLLSKAPGGNQGGILGALVEAAAHATFTPYERIAEENATNMIKTVPVGKYGAK